jgi:ribosomal-protein-alanine N-acetyltransferase
MAVILSKLTINRLELKQVTADHLPQVAAAARLANKEVTKYYGVSYSDVKETEEQMLWYRNLKESGTGIWWANVFLK